MAGDQKVGREAGKKALKEFYRTPWLEIDEDLGAIVAEETDRGAVILMATVVEDILGGAIRKRMDTLSADEDARLFGPDAPLGTFSAKIRMAHALGIIRREKMTMCDLLREMRNACAHSRRAISFDNKPLRDILIVAMSYIFDEKFTSNVHEIHGTVPLVLRLYLMWICGWLSRYVRTGSEKEATDLIQMQYNEMAEAIHEKAASLDKQRAQSRKGHRGSRKAKPRGRQPLPSEA